MAKVVTRAEGGGKVFCLRSPLHSPSGEWRGQTGAAATVRRGRPGGGRTGLEHRCRRLTVKRLRRPLPDRCAICPPHRPEAGDGEVRRRTPSFKDTEEFTFSPRNPPRRATDLASDFKSPASFSRHRKRTLHNTSIPSMGRASDPRFSTTAGCGRAMKPARRRARGSSRAGMDPARLLAARCWKRTAGVSERSKSAPRRGQQ